MHKEGRYDTVWQRCRVHIYSYRRKKKHFGKNVIQEDDIGIWYIQTRRNVQKTFGFSKPDHSNGEGSGYCRDNTGYLLGIRLLGLWFLEAKRSQAVVLCCAGDVQNRNQHAGGWSHTTLGWPLATYVDCCSDVMTADQMFIWHWDSKVGERRMKN